MTMVVLIGLSVAAGMPWPHLVAVTAFVVQPAWAATAAIGAGLLDSRAARSAPDDETVMLAGIASELRSGRSLRQALAGPVERSVDHPLSAVGRLARAGVPIDDLADALRMAFPQAGSLVGPSVAMLATTGGPAAAVFERLAASRAIEAAVERDLRAAKAPGRVSASVLFALVMVACLWLVGSGRVAELATDSIGRGILAGGVVLVAVGSIWIAMLLRTGLR